MKRFILHILLFFAIVSVVDFTSGKLFSYLQSRAGGRTGEEWYVCKEMKEDIVIMGSSRASHHYVPQIITDSLGLSCYNAGQDGNGIILQYGRWKMLLERYTPKIVIYDVNPAFDLCENDNMTYVDRLKPFCDNCKVYDYVTELFPIEKVKLFSQMYRFNYKFIEMVSDNARNSENNLKGYIPLNGVIRKEIVVADSPVKNISIDKDPIKIYYLEKFVQECNEKGVKLFLVASPCFRGGGFSQEVFNVVASIATKYNTTFLYLYDSNYSENPDLFKDSQHLNDNGAQQFTNEIIKCIRL